MIKNFNEYSNIKIYKTFKKGDIITLNIPKVEHIRSLIKSHKLHPFSGPNFKFFDLKWTDGVTATVTSVIKSKDQLRYKFNNISDEYEYEDSYWFFKPIKK